MSDLLTIDRLGHRGDGVAPGAAGLVFVAGALPGEVVETTPPDGDRARLLRVVTPSPDRVAPYCPHVERCGGCATQHLSQPAALAWKREIVAETLRHARLEAAVEPCIDAHGQGRRRATLHARYPGGKGPFVGFTEARSHAVVDLDGVPCPLFAPGLAGALDAVRAAATLLKPLAKPIDAVVTATAAGLDMDLRGTGQVPERLRLSLGELAARHDLARLALHGDVVIERRPPLVEIGRARVVPPPGGFLQATAEGEATLARLVLEGVAGARKVADLFSGSGAFALRMAEQATVHAVEGDKPSIAALDKGRRGTSGLKPVSVEARDLFRRPLQPMELKAFDAVVFDPPRAGAEAQCRALAASKVRRVVAVSCNPATLARDLKILVEGGYRIDRVVPVDQFRHAAHVEVVCCLSRGK